MSNKAKGSKAERELYNLFVSNNFRAVRVAGSGMMDGGRIVHHALRYLSELFDSRAMAMLPEHNKLELKASAPPATKTHPRLSLLVTGSVMRFGKAIRMPTTVTAMMTAKLAIWTGYVHNSCHRSIDFLLSKFFLS